MNKTCGCDYPYIGAHLATEPPHCEKCGGLMDQAAWDRLSAIQVEELAKLEEAGRVDPDHRCELNGCDGSRIGHDLAETFA